MAIEYREIAAAPAGAVIGIIGERNNGQRELLQEAAARPAIARDLSDLDCFEKEHLAIELAEARRAGRVVFLASFDEDLIRRFADEVWWLREGAIAAKGDPSEVLGEFRRHIARKLRAEGDGAVQSLRPSLRRGDGRADLVSLETLNAQDAPTMVWMSGEPAAIRVTVQFKADVPDPVVGIMIRTRIGVEVYGTNTELEKVKLGPCQAGDQRVVTFQFNCDLCPQEYTVTAASHDPDGVWHDWMEDAVAFRVADSRYTAGVANLRAKVIA